MRRPDGRGESRMKIIITILAAIVIIDALIVYSCCVVAGRADEAAEELEAKKYGTFGSEE